MNYVYTLRSDGFYRVGDNTAVPGNGYKGSCQKEIQIEKTYLNKEIIEIGHCAFRSSDIELVHLTDNIQYISTQAFDCCNLKEILIPSSVISLGSYCFAHNQLKSVNIPKSVQTIGTDPFGLNVDLSSITVDPENQYYVTDVYGSLMNKRQTIIIQATPNKEKVIVPPSVNSIMVQAFDTKSKFKEIVITGNLKTVSSEAFNNLLDLETFVYFGYSPIPDNAFYNTNPTNVIVCNNYPKSQLANISVTRTGYCIRNTPYHQNNILLKFSYFLISLLFMTK